MLENSFIIFAPENSDNMSEYKQIKYDKLIEKEKINSFQLSNYNRIEINCDNDDVLVETFQIVKALICLSKIAKRI